MSYQKLEYKEVKSINWFVADTIRDKGNGDSKDYMSVALPILILKRCLDLRTEYKEKKIKSSEIYEFEGEHLIATLPEFMPLHPIYSVNDKQLSWYDIEFNDIVNYPDNPEQKTIVYSLGLGDKGRLNVETNALDRIEFLFEVMHSMSHPALVRYFSVVEFEKITRKILPKAAFIEILNELSKYMFSLEFAPEDIFGDAYMDLIGRFAADGGKKGGEFYTPSNLVKNALRLVKPHFKGNKKIRIADLTAGACTFMTYAGEALQEQVEGDNKKEKVNELVEFITQEKSEVSEQLGIMNMMMHGYALHISFHGNTITQWKDGYIGDYENKIDFMYANPPYGLSDYGIEYATANKQKESRWMYGVPAKGEGEYAFINSIMSLLNEEGKALIVLPLGTLFKDSTQKIRQMFIELDYIEGIVNLPAGMFYTTGIPVCLWIINKNKSEADKGKIFMVNAEEEFTKEGNINVWNADKTVEHYNSRNVEVGFSEYIDFDTLKENDFNLSVSRYVYKEEVKKEIDIASLNNEIEDLYTEILNFRNQNKDLLKGI